MTSNRLDAERKLFKRLVISNSDLEHAAEYLALLRPRLRTESNDKEEKYLLRALQTALIVSYARPFTGEGSEDARATLPGKFERAFDAEQHRLHKTLLRLRHQDFAHSDSETQQVSVGISEQGGVKLAHPIARDSQAPAFTGVHLNLLSEMIAKLQEEIGREWCRIQKSRDRNGRRTNRRRRTRAASITNFAFWRVWLRGSSNTLVARAAELNQFVRPRKVR